MVIERIINDVCTRYIDDFLIEPITELRQAQKEIVEEIIRSYPSVAFGDADELQAKLPSGELSNDAIFGHLSRERFRRDQRQAEKIRSVLARLKETGVNIKSYTTAIKEAGKAIEDAERRSLAEYVVRRKVVLISSERLLEKVRDDTRDTSYQREEILHSFICPLRVNTLTDGTKKIEAAASPTLDPRRAPQHLRRYFSSDVEFATLSASTDSDERADVLIFDHVHGLRQTEEASKVLLVEFKRPGRQSYADDENPQLQVERYIRRLQSGMLFDVKGRQIRLDDRTIFYCFIVADIVGKLDDWTYTWQRTADGRGKCTGQKTAFAARLSSSVGMHFLTMRG